MESYACNFVDCFSIHSGDPCFVTSNLFSRASFAMNAYCQEEHDCKFSGSRLKSITDPSYGNCIFVGSEEMISPQAALVEKRLKLEHPSEQSTVLPSPLLESNKLLTESLSSPIYLDLDPSNNNNHYSSSTLQDSSEAPEVFLSCSPQFIPTQENPTQPNALHHPKTINDTEGEAIVNDIEQLIQLLGLSSCQEGDEEKAGLELKCGGSENGGNSCHCEGGFYEKIVGVKGPKCGREVERLEGWINYFLNADGEGKIEPFRLAHLLLSKAAFVSEGADHGFGGLDFPSTIGDFLRNDPPTD